MQGTRDIRRAVQRARFFLAVALACVLFLIPRSSFAIPAKKSPPAVMLPEVLVRENSLLVPLHDLLPNPLNPRKLSIDVLDAKGTSYLEASVDLWSKLEKLCFVGPLSNSQQILHTCRDNFVEQRKNWGAFISQLPQARERSRIPDSRVALLAQWTRALERKGELTYLITDEGLITQTNVSELLADKPVLTVSTAPTIPLTISPPCVNTNQDARRPERFGRTCSSSALLPPIIATIDYAAILSIERYFVGNLTLQVVINDLRKGGRRIILPVRIETPPEPTPTLTVLPLVSPSATPGGSPTAQPPPIATITATISPVASPIDFAVKTSTSATLTPLATSTSSPSPSTCGASVLKDGEKCCSTPEGDVPYNESTEGCCGPLKFDDGSIANYKFNRDEYACCSIPSQYKDHIPTASLRKNNEECCLDSDGIFVIDPAKQACCTGIDTSGVITSYPYQKDSQGCCLDSDGSSIIPQVYGDDEACCEGSKDGRPLGRVYNTDEEGCCLDEIGAGVTIPDTYLLEGKDEEGNGPFSCCEGVSDGLHRGTVIDESRTGCCLTSHGNAELYAIKDQDCCWGEDGGTVIETEGDNAQGCCRTEHKEIPFSVKSQSCCPVEPPNGKNLVIDEEQCPSTPTAAPSVTGTPEATATDTPEVTPTDTPETTPTDTPEITATDTPEATATDTPEVTPSDTPETTPTDTPEVTATDTPEVTPSDTPETTPTDTPEVTATDTPEVTPSDTPETTPTDTPEVTATDTPEVTPSDTPETTPTDTPEVTATDTPEATATPLQCPQAPPAGYEGCCGSTPFKAQEQCCPGDVVAKSTDLCCSDGHGGSVVYDDSDPDKDLRCCTTGSDGSQEAYDAEAQGCCVSDKGTEIYALASDRVCCPLTGVRNNDNDCCGDGAIDVGEQCDDGEDKNMDGSGCIVKYDFELPADQDCIETHSCDLFGTVTHSSCVKLSSVNWETIPTEHPSVNITGPSLEWRRQDTSDLDLPGLVNVKLTTSKQDDTPSQIFAPKTIESCTQRPRLPEYPYTHRWYGVRYQPPTDNYCEDDTLQSNYRTSATAKFEYTDKDGLHEVSIDRVNDTHVGLPGGNASTRTIHEFGVGTWVEVKPVYERRAVKTGTSQPKECCASLNTTNGQCAAWPEINISALAPDQYWNLTIDEECFHLDQQRSLGLEQGGDDFPRLCTEFFDYITSHSSLKTCVSADIGMKKACNSAALMVSEKLAELETKALKAMEVYGTPPYRCWTEYTAKKAVGLTEAQGSIHYECAYRDCPTNPTQPPPIKLFP